MRLVGVGSFGRRRLLGGCRGSGAPPSAAEWWSRLAAFLGCLLLLAATGATAATSNETAIKSAFLYNFTKFVEWPPDTFSSPTQPIVIGVLDDNSFAAALARLCRDRKVNGRSIMVKVVRTAEESRKAQLLFIGAQEEALFSLIRPALERSPVLTVGESANFMRSGGAIGLVPVNDRLRFEINVITTDRAGLRLSAHLQKLAISVTRKR